MIPPQVRAIAWDIDGTLVDSEPLHHRALLAASAAFGCDLSDLPEQAFRGVHMADVWQILHPRLPSGLTAPEWLAAINEYYIRHRGDLRPMPGVPAVLRRLGAAGYIQVCVSNSARAIVDANLDALGIGADIAFSIALDDVAQGKPAPEPYDLARSRLGLAPDQVLAVEDSAAGLASARAAGLHTLAYRPSDDLRADLRLDDFADLGRS